MPLLRMPPALLLVTAVGLAGCGGSEAPGVTAPAAPSLALAIGLKTLQFSWPAVPNADRFRLLSSPDGSASFTAVDDNLGATSTSDTLDIGAHRIDWDRAQYAVEACNAAGCTRSALMDVRGRSASAVGYLKSSETVARESFGSATAVSGDGKTLAVGAVGTGDLVGALYVFVKENGAWHLQARLQGGASEAGDGLGAALALSSDGNTLVAGAPGENGGATGINGNQRDNSRADAGAAYVFVRSAGRWDQQAYVKTSNTDAHDGFGTSVAIAADGNTVAVGAPYEDSRARQVNGDQTLNGATDAGAAYVFVRSGTQWSQQAYVKASNTDPGDAFGYSLALSGNGNTLVVGAPWEDGGEPGVGGNQQSDGTHKAGAVYVFSRNGAGWSTPIYVKASNPGGRNWFGWSVAVAGDGHTFAVGAPDEDGAASGVGGDQQATGRSHSGAVYVFAQSGASWTQAAYVKAGNPDSDDEFGWALSLNDAGDTLAVGARGESSNARAIGGNSLDNTAPLAGAAYVFRRTASAWGQQAYVKATNADAGDLFGSAVALSSDGNTLTVGAPGEASSATGIGGNQIDNSLFGAGAAYLY